MQLGNSYFPVQLEQYMMEGAYNKVLKARDTAPADYYAFFMEQLMSTVRFNFLCILQFIW